MSKIRTKCFNFIEMISKLIWKWILTIDFEVEYMKFGSQWGVGIINVFGAAALKLFLGF